MFSRAALLCVFTCLAQSSGRITRSQVRTRRSNTKRSAVHAGQRAVAVTRLKKKGGLNVSGLRTELTDVLDGRKGLDVLGTRNYSAAYTTKLKDIHGSEFVGEIGVGTMRLPKECEASLAEVTAAGGAKRATSEACRVREQQTLRVVFDTGSTNIWMASDLCGGLCARTDRHRYNHTESATYVEPARQSYLDIRFGTASLKGPRAIDNFHVGPFTIKHQAFNLIEQEVGYSFEKLPLEGIVGLAFPTMAATGEVPFFDNVIKQGLLFHNEFAFYVGDGTDGNDGGAVFWGGVDPDLFEGSIHMFPVTQAHYWAIDLIDFRVGNESLSMTGGKRTNVLGTDSDHVEHNILLESPPQRVVRRKQQGQSQDTYAANKIPKLLVDSGTTYVVADPQLRAEVAQRVPDGYCDDTVNYPSLVFTLKDVAGRLHDLELSPKDYMASADGGQTCELSLMELVLPEKYGPGMVVGELFMRRYFTVFDRGDGGLDDARIGFARARHDAQK